MLAPLSPLWHTHTLICTHTPKHPLGLCSPLCVFHPQSSPRPIQAAGHCCINGGSRCAPRMLDCSAWQTASPWLGPKHCPATIQRWPQDLFWNRDAHFAAPSQMFWLFSFPCLLFFFLPRRLRCLVFWSEHSECSWAGVFFFFFFQLAGYYFDKLMCFAKWWKPTMRNVSSHYVT